MCGEKGEDWLERLPGIVRELEGEWGIKVQKPFRAAEFNFVAPAVGTTSDLVVLKISPPFETDEILGEAAYLKTKNGNGAIKLIRQDIDQRAILIEHALPGENLVECFKDNEPASVAPAIQVLRAILGPPPVGAGDITTLDKWFDGLRRYESTKFPADYATRALQIYEDLSVQANRTYYLHGDFHPGNIVNATREPYLVIDPKGIVGHIGYEIAVFLNNFHWWQEGAPDIQARLETAIKQFSDAFDIDPLELRQWAYAQMVIGAWWSFEDMPQYYDNSVAKADIWNV
jgi:streptomycin 6-kinase